MVKFLRAKQCAELFGIHPNTWWLWVRDGKVPKGTNIGANTTVWRSDDLQAVMDRLVPRQIVG